MLILTDKGAILKNKFYNKCELNLFKITDKYDTLDEYLPHTDSPYLNKQSKQSREERINKLQLFVETPEDCVGYILMSMNLEGAACVFENGNYMCKDEVIHIEEPSKDCIEKVEIEMDGSSAKKILKDSIYATTAREFPLIALDVAENAIDHYTIAKKVRIFNDGTYDCPMCGNSTFDFKDCFCSKCGQRLTGWDNT